MRKIRAIAGCIALLLLTVLCLPVCASAAEVPFRDVPQDAWFCEAAQYARDNGIIKGVGRDLFDPEGDVNRAMFVTMLFRMDGAPKTWAACPFRDVATGAWYEESVTWASANEIVSGVSAAAFSPMDRINREQMAAILYRYAQYKGYDVSPKAALSSFADAAAVHGWAEDAMAWSCAAGLISGVGDGLLDPEGRSTRAQAAAVLMRFEKNVTLQQAETVAVPILTYHNVAQGASDTVISRQMLEKHFAALREAGYHTVFPSELRDFVFNGAPLPEKPLVITFDDGYLSNATEAFPLLEKYDMKAAFFIIGVSFGASTYKDTGKAIIPHFGAEEAARMRDSGHVEIGSHTYDLHQSRFLEQGPEVRENLRKLPTDTDEKYVAVVRNDTRRFADFYRTAVGGEADVFSYPRGAVTDEAAAVLREEGFTVTLTSERGVNTVVRGLPRSLIGMKRFNVSGELTASQLLELIEQSAGL